jgi:hypothetical protein
MTLDPLLKLRPWLTLGEAAQALSSMIEKTEKPVTEANVLRLALDGHLKLSVYLPEGTAADCWDLPEGFPEEVAVDYWQDLTSPNLSKPKHIGGIWDVPLILPASRLVERIYNELSGLPPITTEGTVGPLVERLGVEVGDDAVHCRLHIGGASHSPASPFPPESKFVVRTEAITEFVSAISNLVDPSPADPLDKPLGERAQATLLTIIAALAKRLEIDVTNHSEAGDKIDDLTTELLGVRIPSRTVQEYLKRIPDALERRSKLIPGRRSKLS